MTSGDPSIPSIAPVAGPGLDLSGGMSAELLTGKLSAGFIGGIVIGLGAFYIWTRHHQL